MNSMNRRQTQKLLALLAGSLSLSQLSAQAIPGSTTGNTVRTIYVSHDTKFTLVPYHDAKSNLSFNYPQSWRVQPDKDSVVKLRGTIGRCCIGKFYHFAVWSINF